MSIMFPTIFALGIFGLGVRAKKASAYIVMAIMGGALLPKAHGRCRRRIRHVARLHRAAVVLRVVVAAYGYLWPKLAGADSMNGVDVTKGH